MSTDPRSRAGHRPLTARVSVFAAALAGLVAAGILLAIAEALALVVGATGSPLLAIGSVVIDHVPKGVKELVIGLFGTNDKLVLLLSLGLGVAIGSAVAGILEYARRPLGVILFALAACAGVAALITRPGASTLAALPTLVGAVAGILFLRLVLRRLRQWRGTQAEQTTTVTDADRRVFLRVTVLGAAAAAVVGTGARLGSAALTGARAVRDAVTIPTPSSRVTVPEGAELGVSGVSDFYTSNADFYRIDTALAVPQLDPDTWRLTVGGLVEKEVTLSYADLLAMGVREYSITMTCVSNEVGGSLIGTAKWLGVPLREVLALANPSGSADMVLSTSTDGYSAGTPLEALTDPKRDAILAVAMNGKPLPREHGFPVRMVVPGLYGYVSATKWVTDLKVTRFADDQGYWVPRGYAAKAPIKLSSRLDTPTASSQLSTGSVVLGGVAWAQPVGVRGVQVSIDDGPWQKATISTPVNGDTWVQWTLDWTAKSGLHYVEVRATDQDGTVQTGTRKAPLPDGSTGHQRVLLRVS